MDKNTFVILGNQLFEPCILKSLGCEHVFMAEDYGLCTYEKHHKLKIYLFFCAMREYRDELQNLGIQVSYFSLEQRDENVGYVTFLCDFLEKNNITRISLFEIEDRPFETELTQFLDSKNIEFTVHDSPMFMLSREDFAINFGKNKTFRLANFYKLIRKRYKILVDDNYEPAGQQWSFDEENRKRIPNDLKIPSLVKPSLSRHHGEVVQNIEMHFSDHPGQLDNVWFPVTRSSVQRHLDHFLKERFHDFGVYEDAMRHGENFLFHSCISPFLNIGLITPKDLVNRILEIYERNEAPINSVEGYIRQVLGWREFIRGIYQLKGEEQEKSNFWGHARRLTPSWYDGSTGIVPLDDSIHSAVRDGYNHHIPRLMIISNLMNLCEIDPKFIYKWFMEMYIDSSDWVMVPNVFGMATFADGGLMSTKPYTCSSNYMLKMSNYKKSGWCDIVDGLYWRFIEKHKDFYQGNPRLSFQTRMLGRMDPNRKTTIFRAAEKFIESHTA